MNILHAIHKLYPGPQETPFISEATDFSKIILIFICNSKAGPVPIKKQIQFHLF